MKIEFEILANADLCVKCGLCLPHCPTYDKTRNENESPRGRIALIQAWAGGSLPASEKLLSHIDNCLLCRSCERVCPAMVPYGKLVDDFRCCVSSASKDSLALSLLKNISHSSQLNAIAGSLLNLYQASGLKKTGIARLVKLERINRLLPAVSSKKVTLEQQIHPTINPVKGEVGLFQGCMGNLLDQATVTAAIRVLNHAGFNVYLPSRQTCCGALDLHSGDAPAAKKLETKNIDAFSERPLDVIITIASGCGATLQEYEDSDFSGKIMDISQFLYQANALDRSRFSVLDAKVIVHTPCSLRNVMQADDSVIQLVKQIPGVEIVTFPEAIICCGSAGSYMLEHKEMANALLDDLLLEVTRQLPKYLITSNIGCALHIAAGLKEKGIDLEVIHPVVMIDRVFRANVMNGGKRMEPGNWATGSIP